MAPSKSMKGLLRSVDVSTLSNLLNVEPLVGQSNASPGGNVPTSTSMNPLTLLGSSTLVSPPALVNSSALASPRTLTSEPTYTREPAHKPISTAEFIETGEPSDLRAIRKPIGPFAVGKADEATAIGRPCEIGGISAIGGIDRAKERRRTIYAGGG
jgi:hypothetical protein